MSKQAKLCILRCSDNPWSATDYTWGLYGYFRGQIIEKPMTPETEPAKKNPISRPRGKRGIVIPDEIRQKLPNTPDHIEEARRECVHQFIEAILLPRMEDEDPLTALELQRIALEHKLAFQEEHPRDFVGNFELLPAVEMELLKLHIRCETRRMHDTAWEGITHLVERAANEMKPLLDDHLELYSV